jgi:hypothetical protein
LADDILIPENRVKTTIWLQREAETEDHGLAFGRDKAASTVHFRRPQLIMIVKQERSWLASKQLKDESGLIVTT